MNLCLRLFLSFLQIGAFSFGGGYAAMPLIQEQVVTINGWLNVKDFTDLVTISQMTPGPISINAATFVGNRVAGLPGAFFATLGVTLPSCVFVTILACLYVRYRSLSMMQGILKSLRPAVVAMIFVAGLIIMIPAFFENVRALPELFTNTNYAAVLYFVIALILLRKFKKDPVFVMVLTGVMELVLRLVLRITA
jgi:chromate transporter